MAKEMLPLKAAIIGFGRMGRFYLQEFKKNPKYLVSYICDVDPKCRNLARQLAPEAVVTESGEDIFNDPSVDVVVLSATAGGRAERIKRAVSSHKHIIAEKPLSDTIDSEAGLVELTRDYGGVCTVNLYLRNSWYHNLMKAFVDSGEIGDPAILRICHMTPGLAPGEGHESEGPCFHDCGMHYVDIARWYAGSEYKTMHSQGVRMWDWKDPWWVQCHGTFGNGIVYDITQGFVYGQLSKDQSHNSYVEVIGSGGVARMSHDFRTAHVELRGETKTEIIDRPYGGKNIGVLIGKVADSIISGHRDTALPTFEDAAIASKVSWEMFYDAFKHDLPVKGTASELERIRLRRSEMNDGYGLLPSRHKNI